MVFMNFLQVYAKAFGAYVHEISRSVFEVEFLPFFLLKPCYTLKTELNIAYILLIENITGLLKIYQLHTFPPFYPLMLLIDGCILRCNIIILLMRAQILSMERCKCYVMQNKVMYVRNLKLKISQFCLDFHGFRNKKYCYTICYQPDS